MGKASRSFWSRPWAPLFLGAAGCAACCVPPLLAIIIGAGAATTATAIVEPIAGAMMAGGALLAIALLVRWRLARSAGAACAIDGGCGCHPAKDPAS